MNRETQSSRWLSLLFICCSSLGALPLYGQAPASAGPIPFHGLAVRNDLTTLPIEQRVEDLLKQMTLEEKVGQLVQYSIGTPTGPGTGRGNYDDMIASGQVGSLFNLDNVTAANHYQHIAVEKSRLHIPLLFGLDVIHGYRTTFPVPLAMASTWDPPIVERAAHLAAEEATADGVRWAFSPMVDIARDAALGTNGRRCRRGSFSRKRNGARVCSRVSRQAIERTRQYGSLCETLCGIRSGRKGTGLQHCRNFRTHPAGDLSPAVLRGA